MFYTMEVLMCSLQGLQAQHSFRELAGLEVTRHGNERPFPTTHLLQPWIFFSFDDIPDDERKANCADMGACA